MAKAPIPSDDTSARPYHHGDLRRALTDAARTIIERDGPQALSLRAGAREAGVSPAAPYHHFKDKQELMLAVGKQGFEDLGKAMKLALDTETDPTITRTNTIGLAYVMFARRNPALYRVMYDCARDLDALPHEDEEKDMTGYNLVREALVAAGAAAPDDLIGIEVACASAWCFVHGVAEMSSFAQFDPLKEALGGEENFYRELLRRVGAFSGR
jgi:AcrR family transcriptional regulator